MERTAYQRQHKGLLRLSTLKAINRGRRALTPVLTRSARSGAWYAGLSEGAVSLFERVLEVMEYVDVVTCPQENIGEGVCAGDDAISGKCCNEL